MISKVASIRRSGINGNYYQVFYSNQMRSVIVASIRRSGINGNVR